MNLGQKLAFQTAVFIFACSLVLGVALLVLYVKCGARALVHRWLAQRKRRRRVREQRERERHQQQQQRARLNRMGVQQQQQPAASKTSPRRMLLLQPIQSVCEATFAKAAAATPISSNTMLTVAREKFVIPRRPRPSYADVRSKYVATQRASPRFTNYLHRSVRPFLGYMPQSKERDRATSFFY